MTELQATELLAIAANIQEIAIYGFSALAGLLLALVFAVTWKG